MTISEMIVFLEDYRKEHGNIEVKIPTFDGESQQYYLETTGMYTQIDSEGTYLVID